MYFSCQTFARAISSVMAGMPNSTKVVSRDPGSPGSTFRVSAPMSSDSLLASGTAQSA